MDGVEKNYRGGFTYTGLLELVRELRQQQTPAELVFWELVRKRRFYGLKLRRQHQIGLCIVDFYCHEKRLVVELDGEIHDARLQNLYDRQREAYLHSLGLTVFRVSNDFLLNAPERVLSDLITFMNLPLSPWERGQG